MAQTVSILLQADDGARLAAVIGDRNRPQKHVLRARIVLLSADRLPVNYAIASQWSMDVAYRYVDLGSAYGAIDSGAQIKGDLTSNELFAGVRYQF